ncbi:hypothetical protein WK78_03935 [Burkholderia cepacia]|nr:hypothetical protein WK78_03935 [Burkholderia cepacia]
MAFAEGRNNVVLAFDQFLPTFSFDARSLTLSVSIHELLKVLSSQLQTRDQSAVQLRIRLVEVEIEDHSVKFDQALTTLKVANCRR